MSQSIIRQWVYKLHKKSNKNMREREREPFVWENKMCIKWKRVTNLQYEDKNKKKQKKEKKKKEEEEEEDKGAKLYVKLKPSKRNMYRQYLVITLKLKQIT